MSVAFDLESRLEERCGTVDAALDGYLPPETGIFARLNAAMRYSVFAGGKRLRPVLVLECCEVAGGDPDDAMPAACAVEMIHTYSLIHDDLPAMDDDDLRRGRPSCHRQFDEATAILAGDALLALAFGTASHTGSDAVAREVVRTLASAAGPRHLVGGQMLDMVTVLDLATPDDVEAIHETKTAGLLAASSRTGAVVARGCVDDMVESLEGYGRALGRAFQIADDILDVTSTSEELGKTPGKDVTAGKATYPGVAGMEAARARAFELADEAVGHLVRFGGEAECLRAIARYVIERKS